MFNELFHRLLFPTLVATVVGTVWVVGWAQTVINEANRGWWPPIALPGRPAMVSVSEDQMPSDNIPSDRIASEKGPATQPDFSQRQ
jgi:hypothetical protein